MILRDLLPTTVPVQIHGSVDLEISQLVYDSRLAKPGALFFALPGTKNDGARFIDQACARGARAVVVPPGTVVAGQVTTIFSDTPRLLLGLMADRFYHSPSARLTLIGVTGTSGKTTTTYLLEAIWRAMGWSAGVIGTVNYRYQDRELPAPFTTPEAVELQELLSTMAAHEVSHVVMEVSSHALAQERVQGCRWDGAVFTNLGRDHLDFHRDLADYFAAKSRLFLQALAASPKPQRFAVINADDPWGTVLLAKPIPDRVLTYGLQSGVTVSARNVEKSLQGLRGILRLDEEEVTFSSSLIGEPHLYNILAAVTVAHALGVPAERIVAGIAQCTHVPGRLEAVSLGQPFTVLVDYAHKPDALEKVLRSVRQLTTHRLLTVFGCGGDRDRGKRPLMGEAAGRLSDVVILTSDNPRTEDPGQIIAEAEVGLVQAGQLKVTETAAVAALPRGYLVIADRRTAIRTALVGARSGDVVVIAGKGHEDYQIIGTTKYHFDDREEVRHYLQTVYGEGRA
ncbi:MAG TPA: UDP-N-acetylmuramoyl-L-alanyl-D-glutamate--2,6-diaminopimelate ligase [Candidatus Binatia bacterium]|jgi:UDP-N-acetylmuramoyl-L-alanyl-D-glutamate--2,6-diaminopimelate ligase|nr:UDP-N-acetylmuramoyl-L-alanyl-D-glutamate--2,6-diaminopimelate ligase [Candidatus Binatia bacterium]